MYSPIKIAHTSDVHLDGNAGGQPINGFRNVAEAAFAYVIEAAREEECDLFLLVGDLFDHARIPAHDFEFVHQQFEKLECPIVVIPGNHDLHDDQSVWKHFNELQELSNIHFLLEECGTYIQLPELDMALWGRGMAEHSPENRPLEGIPSRSEHKWYVGLAHGQVVKQESDYVSSIITETEIANSGFDYLALGHVHVWEEFNYHNTIACYPGSPVKAFSTSRGGFFALVTLSENGVSIEKREVPAPPSVEEPQHFHFAPGT